MMFWRNQEDINAHEIAEIDPKSGNDSNAHLFPKGKPVLHFSTAELPFAAASLPRRGPN